MSTRPWHIVVAEAYADEALARLRAVGTVTLLPACDEAALREAVRDADALLLRTYARVTEAVLADAKRLRVVGRGGVGLDNVDIEAARRRGIAVVYTPAAGTNAVADLTIGLLIALSRRIKTGEEMLRAGRFAEARRAAGDLELAEMTLGIVGLGRIGKAVARRARHGFGMTILYNDIEPQGLLDFVAAPVDKDELCARSDAVTLHVPLTDLTRRMIDDAALAKFKPGALLINTARGPVIDEAAVARTLVEGRLGGAAIDVYEHEPPAPDSPLLAAPNTILTPHIASRTRRCLAAMNDVVDDMIRVLRGEKPRYPA